MFENLGMGELLIIMFVVLILFGGKKIKKGVNDLKKEITITDDDLTKHETKKLN